MATSEMAGLGAVQSPLLRWCLARPRLGEGEEACKPNGAPIAQTAVRSECGRQYGLTGAQDEEVSSEPTVLRLYSWYSNRAQPCARKDEDARGEHQAADLNKETDRGSYDDDADVFGW